MRRMGLFWNGLSWQVLTWGLVCWLSATTQGAAQTPDVSPQVRDLAQVMRLGDATAVMREEGFDHGDSLDQDMLQGQGGAVWLDRVGSIYRTQRIEDRVLIALEAGMTDSQISDTRDFFASADGQTILRLEIAARRAMSDPAVEAAMKARVDGLRGSDDLLWEQVQSYVRINHMLERNLAASLADSVAFYGGMADSGGLTMDDAMIRALVWADRDATAQDVDDWVMAMLVMAYSPLTTVQMQDYLDFSASEAGQALNDALYEGFNAVFRDIAQELGFAVGQAMQSSTL